MPPNSSESMFEKGGACCGARARRAGGILPASGGGLEACTTNNTSTDHQVDFPFRTRLKQEGDSLHEFTVGDEDAGLRLDVFLAEQIEDASRSFVQKLIKADRVQVSGKLCARPSRTLCADDTVIVEIPPAPEPIPQSEDIPLEILHEDRELVVVNKPSGLVVHPAPGHYTGTLVNAVLFHCPDFSRPGTDATRPGIVHRLDQYTSGVMVVAKTDRAFAELSRQAREHSFDRCYLALVRGETKEDRGRIEAPVGRSTADPSRMAVTGVRGRDAVSHFVVLERFGVASLVRVTLETGRTHQVRVHLRFAGRPVLGDSVYGVTDFSSWNVPASVKAALARLPGQALHAERLGFTHPATGERLIFTAPPPAEFQAVLTALRGIPRENENEQA